MTAYCARCQKVVAVKRVGDWSLICLECGRRWGTAPNRSITR